MTPILWFAAGWWACLLFDIAARAACELFERITQKVATDAELDRIARRNRDVADWDVGCEAAFPRDAHDGSAAD